MSQSGSSKKLSPAKRSPLSSKARSRFGAKVKNVGVNYEICCYGFAPLCIEAFEYCKIIGDGVSEAHSQSVRRFMETLEGEGESVPELTEGGFFASVHQ